VDRFGHLKDIVGWLTSPDQANCLGAEGEWLPAILEPLLECASARLPTHLAQTEMRRKSIPMLDDVIALGDHTTDGCLQVDHRLPRLGSQP
jgi:hypothetical protein